jgi:hypothetical protein
VNSRFALADKCRETSADVEIKGRGGGAADFGRERQGLTIVANGVWIAYTLKGLLRLSSIPKSCAERDRGNRNQQR